MTKSSPAAMRAQLERQRRKVDFDTYDLAVEELVSRLGRGKIEIAPSYQRQFRWDPARQSRLLESLFLGIPVPPLFMATNVAPGYGNTWEVVDGLQRLLSMTHFVAPIKTINQVNLGDTPLKLRGMEILTTLEGADRESIPEDLVDILRDRPVKIIVLNDKSDLKVRFDLFERLNTGGVGLTDQEIREAVYGGEFLDLVSSLARSPEFEQAVNIPPNRKRDGTPEEMVLRFFAFGEKYEYFDHSVKDFLNDFCEEASLAPDVEYRRMKFERTMQYLAQAFPGGIRRGRQSTTPVNMYEGVAVGCMLALDENPSLGMPISTQWAESDEFRSLTTGATNSRKSVTGRIEFARDRFLSGS